MPKRNHFIPLGVLGVLAVQSAVLGQGNAAPAVGEAKELLKKTFDVYATAKSYQGDWTFTLQRGMSAQKAAMEIRSKGPTHLYFRIAPAPGEKPAPGAEPIPEMLVVLDGKTATFWNGAENAFFKVTLPKNAQSSPLMFIPQIPAASAVERGPDIQDAGKSYIALQTTRTDGGTSRMEIDPGTYRIHRIVSQNSIALTTVTSNITVEKETLNADIPDSLFSFKVPKGAKEIPAPPGAEAMFGVPDKEGEAKGQ